MTDFTIEERVASARIALEAYVVAKEGRAFCDGDGLQDMLCDLLADLRHMAEAEEVDFKQALESSEMHWDAERAGGVDD